MNSIYISYVPYAPSPKVILYNVFNNFVQEMLFHDMEFPFAVSYQKLEHGPFYSWNFKIKDVLLAL